MYSGNEITVELSKFKLKILDDKIVTSENGTKFEYIRYDPLPYVDDAIFAKNNELFLVQFVYSEGLYFEMNINPFFTFGRIDYHC